MGRVQASHAALQATEHDYRQSQAQGGVSPGEAADYRACIAGPLQRFFGACADLAMRSSDWILSNTPCPPHMPTLSRPAAVDQATEQTPHERTAAQVQHLDAALSEFDEMLLREQERVKAATPPMTASASGTGGAGAATGGAADGTSGDNADLDAGDDMADADAEAVATATGTACTSSVPTARCASAG